MARQDKLGTRATSVHTHGDVTYVTYHSTDVVKFDSDNIILDTGGWYSATTKSRMNQASRQFNLGYTVYQKDFQWHVDHTKRDGTQVHAQFTGDWIGLSR